MTYDEAVKYLSSYHWELTEDQARGLLDALDYRRMTDRIGSQIQVIERLEAKRLEWIDRAGELADERDAARALADRLYGDVEEGCHVVNHNYGRSDDDAARCKGCDARTAWRARDWRPISPPGSGLDGLLTDINREKA